MNEFEAPILLGSCSRVIHLVFNDKYANTISYF